MRRTLLMAVAAAVLMTGWQGDSPPALGQIPGVAQPVMEAPRFPDFQTVIRGAKEHDGFFKLYHKDDHVYCEIRPEQMNQPWLCAVSVARGGGMGGAMLNFDEDWALYFKRVGDKIFLVRRNVHFKANPGSPIAKAVETTYTDSVLMALRIATINPMRNAPLINLNDIFMTDFAQLGLGFFDANRSTWHSVKAFPKNDELQVAATFAGGGRRGGLLGLDDGNIDARGKTIVIHYSLVQLPDSGFHSRLADDRVGHFLSAVKDFSKDDKDTSFVRYINRWRLERAEPVDSKNPNKLSAPKKKIVYWIEKSVPDEYRAAVRDGILEWNKAFEKIGYRDAIEVRQQEEDASGDFDPEDVRFSTFRWITTDMSFAMGPSRVNPLTGEIIDADIIFDASWIRYWKGEQKVLANNGLEIEPASPVLHARRGLDLLEHPLLLQQGVADGWNDQPQSLAALNELRMKAVRQGLCQCCSMMKHEMGMAAMALAARGMLKPGEKVPDEVINQAIKEVTMHEVGHTLGLRHNFKASTMLKNEDLHKTEITRKQGLVGSVMDYAPANIAPKGVKQGDYFTTTIGPYDYWAIEYAYKPISGNEAEELAKVAAKGAAIPGDYGTDEDVFLTADPLINRYDLGADPMKFAEDRIKIADEMIKELADKIVDKGEGHQRARVALSIALAQYGNGAHFIGNYIGGEHAHRDHKGDEKGRDPLVPVKAAKQREALKFLQEHILTDKSFQFSPALLRKLAVERWSHWGSRAAHTDYPLHDRILNIQRVVLDRVFDATVLVRIQNNSLKTEKDEQPLTIAEVLRSVTDGVWSDLPNGPDKNGKRAVASSIIRRNLQREHLKNLYTLVLGEKSGGSSSFFFSGGSVPPDARSLARYHLRDIDKRIESVINDKQAMLDETTRAHLEEAHERIGKVLTASMQVNDP